MGVEAPSPARSEAPSEAFDGARAGTLAARRRLPRRAACCRRSARRERDAAMYGASIGDGAPRGDASRGVSGG